MSKSLNDISVESMLTDLFTTESDTAIPDLDEEIVTTEEEDEILTGPTEKKEGADEADLAEKGQECLGELNTMQLALRTAEEYIWSVSEEADKGGEGIWKKFWNWLKKIFEKAKLYLVTTFKRIQIWIAGDMKNIAKWADENKESLGKIGGSKAKIKMVLPLKSWEATVQDWKKDSIDDKELEDAMNKLLKPEGDADMTKSLNDWATAHTIKNIRESIFKKDAKSEEVTVKQFESRVFKISENISRSGIAKFKTSADALNTAIKLQQKAISTAAKNASRVNTDTTEGPRIKSLASAMQRALNTYTTVNVWYVSYQIRFIKQAFALAKKAVNEIK